LLACERDGAKAEGLRMIRGWILFASGDKI
jgi:hypothetical protein